MERLTVNKPVSEMSMVELAFNCCYISQDGSASYRYFQTDVDAREFTRRLMRIYGDEDLSDGDTELDEEIMTELQYDPEIYPSALIALFYRNMWAMAELRERLKRYEDAEEQGLLFRLPCKVGDTVYFIDRRYDREKREFIPFVHNGYVKAIKFSARPTKVTIEYEDVQDSHGRCKGHDIHASNIGKTVFLTKEEAEQKLESMKGE